MLSGLILAGGRSSRMGRDKAILTLPDGRTLLERQLAVLAEVGAAPLLASVRPDFDGHLPAVTRVTDAVPDAGPLAGLAAGLRAAPAGWLLVLAVDMPAIEAEHLRRLVALAADGCGVVPVVAGRVEPLAAVYATASAASAEAALLGGQRTVHAWAAAEAAADRLRFWTAPDEWAAAFRSWNRPDDVAR